ncbi:MAG: glycosyltransferase [Chloroflexi bacterium]|nr:glycosyltransferase [Chloroflexota bacterium]
MKLALVHDWLNQIGGAEDVLDVLARHFNASPIYTSIYAQDRMPANYRAWDIRPLWLNKLPAIHSRHQIFLPLYPLAWNSLRLSDFDVILSNKSGFCHGLQFDERSLHICYCLAPTRYVWQLDSYLDGEDLGSASKLLLKPLTALLRRWDYAAAQRVSHFIAISSAVKERISRYYNRDATVIFPPVDTARFQPASADDTEHYYLIVSRLIPYKRIDLAVQAATELRLPLKVAGAGRDLERLRALAGDTVSFLGYVPDADLPRLMANCKALIFPGLEDFGITPVQAQAAGRPVIAFRGGGALDTVLPATTGEFFSRATVESLKEVWRNFDPDAYNPEEIRHHARRFDTSIFVDRIGAYVEQAWQARQSKGRFHYQDPVAATEG